MRRTFTVIADLPWRQSTTRTSAQNTKSLVQMYEARFGKLTQRMLAAVKSSAGQGDFPKLKSPTPQRHACKQRASHKGMG